MIVVEEALPDDHRLPPDPMRSHAPPAARVAAPAAAAPPPAPVTAGPVAAPPPAPSGDAAIAAKVLEVVAQHTGYPLEMLELDLDLEADLGIDTVKQAEVFATIRETYDIARDEDLSLRDYPTLQHVIGFVYENRPELKPAAATPAPAPAATPAAPAEAAPAAPAEAADAVEQRILDFVTERTR